MRFRTWLERWDFRLWTPIIGAVLLVPSLWSGLTADDHYLRMVLQGYPGLPEFSQDSLNIFTFADGDVERNAAAMERGLLPWWSVPSLRLAFWRPISALTHWLDHRLWPDNTVLVHAHSIFWYVALALVVACFYRRFFTPIWVAALAALMYVIDDAHVIAASWVSSRNSIITCLFAVLALLFHDRWRRGGRGSGALLASLCFAASLMSCEAGIGVAGYLFAYALFVDERSRKSRLVSLIPYAVIVVVWRVAYVHLGYGVDGSGIYLDPTRVPMQYLSQSIVRMPALLMAQFAAVHPGARMIMTPREVNAYGVSVVVTMVFIAWMLWPQIRRDRMMRFWSVGMVLSLLPACAALPEYRLLFIPGLGGLALVAHFIHAYVSKSPWLTGRTRRRRPAKLLFALWILGFVILPPLMGVPGEFWMAAYHDHVMRLHDDIPKSPGVADEDVIIVTLPSDVWLHSIPYVRSSLRWPSPRALMTLHAGVGTVELKRTDARTLVLRSEKTFVSKPWAQMFRGPVAYPFAAGDSVRLSNVSIDVLDVDERSRPTRVRFRFDKELEAAANHWLTWSDDNLVPFTLPGVGESVRLTETTIGDLAGASDKHFFSSRKWMGVHRLETGPL